MLGFAWLKTRNFKTAKYAVNLTPSILTRCSCFCCDQIEWLYDLFNGHFRDMHWYIFQNESLSYLGISVVGYHLPLQGPQFELFSDVFFDLLFS